jgi:hypothetical protein
MMQPQRQFCQQPFRTLALWAIKHVFLPRSAADV